MFKPTAPLQRRLRRLALTTKMTNKGYYKGNRVGSMGTIDRFGKFAPDYSKIRTYPPAVEKPDLTPFVTKFVMKKNPERDTMEAETKMSPAEQYYEAWKSRGAQE
ncbi:hypothetical protein BCR34DRAFT_563170 [Clohesyomyces aquaticus]|uniref:Mitochondrial ribosomal protein L27-domain-containing protein n=1 Tax=Clohesyomyces aquaticus TaxID=1231657 RepID=A0A1Y1ZRI5_9PLEO|nr:hypothetical protein BCR34DRAFT_563170 [Clohesyomyces aquaticus]